MTKPNMAAILIAGQHSMIVSLREKLQALLHATRLHRNVIITDAYGFKGRWIAVPESDFDKLRELAREIQTELDSARAPDENHVDVRRSRGAMS